MIDRMKRTKLSLTVLSLFLISIPVFAGFGFIFSQQNSEPQIDKLLERADSLYLDESFDNALEIYRETKELSQEKNYSKGLTLSYLGLSGVYFMKGKLDVSTSYLLKAKAESYASSDPKVGYTIHFWEGLYHHALGLYDDAINRYKDAIEISHNIEDEEDRLNKIFGAYVNIGDIYQLKKESDSALYYYKSAYYSPTTNLNNKFTSAISISELHIEKNQLDSGRIYLKYAEQFSKEMNTNLSKALLEEISGKYYLAKEDFTSAINSFETAIELNKKINRPRAVLYKLISETYQKNGEAQISNSYLIQYVSIRDSLEEARKGNIRVPMMLAQVDGEKKAEKASSYLVLVFIGSGILVIAVLIWVYFFTKKQRKKSLKGKKENLQLKKKLNNAFEEVVELANANSPNFLSRFIEVYPEFYSELVNDYPDLTTADLKLCALMKLDFSTKEIAEMTFSSLRTVQNRKYKLRKKFGLTTEENLNQWIQNFHVETLTIA
jgi:tetratricopeptide (TPR) repeat protein